MKISAEIRKYKWDGYHKHYIGTQMELIEVEQVSEWRKGLCLCKEEKKGSWRYDIGGHLKSYRMFLVNTDMEAVFYHVSDYYWELANLDSLPMERIFGGYYITYEGKSKVLGTYPGQDRDTEYMYYQQVCDVITEDGKVLDESEKQHFLKTYTLKKGKELGENRVLLGNELYCLDDYSFISRLPQNIDLEGKYIDGKIKTYILNDERDFYVLVQRRKIIRSFEAKAFAEVVDIVDSTFLQKENKPFRKRPTPTEGEEIIDISPEYVSVIDGYLYAFPIKYGTSCTNIPRFWLDKVLLYQGEFSGYYKERGVWYRIKHEDIYNKMIEMQKNNFPIPNFIKEISFIRKLKYQSKPTDLYLFKCRPYGFLNENGELEYHFDPNNIVW